MEQGQCHWQKNAGATFVDFLLLKSPAKIVRMRFLAIYVAKRCSFFFVLR